MENYSLGISNAPILVKVYRGKYIESIHRGYIAIVDTNGNIKAKIPEYLPSIFSRSALKPFQLLPLLLNGIDKKFNLSEQELAVMLSSHSGQNKHIELINSILYKLNLNENILQCGFHEPLDKNSAIEFYKSSKNLSPIYCNCSGKHLSMIAICKYFNWDITNYIDIAHPVQELIRKVVLELTELKELNNTIDGCSAPVYILPIQKLAYLYALLSNPQGKYKEFLAKIKDIMVKYPDLVAGDNRFDTDFILNTEGKFISKWGSEGVCGIGIVGKNLGLAIKVEDGNKRAIGPAVIEALKQIGKIDKCLVERLDKLYKPILYNFNKLPVGHIEACFELNIQ